MPSPGRPDFTPAQNRVIGNAGMVLRFCRDLGMDTQEAIDVMHACITLLSTDKRDQQNHRTHGAANPKRAEK